MLITTKQYFQRGATLCVVCLTLLLALVISDFSSIPQSASPLRRKLVGDPRTVQQKNLLSFQQSAGFFDDIPDANWLLLQSRHDSQFPNHLVPEPYADTRPQHWFQNNFEPEFTCQHEKRIGAKGDGGKWICDPHRIAKQPKCLVYSIGSNGDTSFEQGIKKELPNCEIHTFDIKDFTKWVAPHSNFHQWGIGTSEQEEKNGNLPFVFHTLKNTVQRLGHQHRVIDIFKIDCEGCEWRTFVEWFDIATLGTTIRQIQVELHGTPRPVARDFFYMLHDFGYAIFHKEPNILGSSGGGLVEYAFIKLNQEFYRDKLYKNLDSKIVKL